MKKTVGIYLAAVLCLFSVSASADYMDGFVDMEDYATLAADWQNPADIDDLALLAGNWLTYYVAPPSVAWWEMEETSGSIVYDSTDNAYDLDPTDGFVIADAATGGMDYNAFAFDGSGERLTEPTLLDDFPDAITIAGWVRPDATGMSKTQTWFSKINADALGYSINLTCKMSGSTPNVIVANGRSYNPATEPTPYVGEYFNCNSAITWVDDTWYHIAFTWDATGCEIFVDGQPEGSDDMPIMGDVIPDRNAVDLTIGNGGDTTQPLTEPFKGVIDDVRLYDSVLSASAIQSIYGSASGLITYPLVVNNGAGDGNYTLNTLVEIIADAPAFGQEFDVWTGDTAVLANVNDSTTTVTMPAAAVTVTATYKAATQYTLTVNSGSGDGSYYEGQIINITADAPPAGQEFDVWTGDIAYVANVNDSSTTVTIPGQNVTVTATYKVPTSEYTLTVNNGTGDGDYEEDTVVPIAANTAPAGQVFDVWIGDTAYIANVNDQTTTVTMPASNVSVTATYKTAPTAFTITVQTDFPGGNALINGTAGTKVITGNSVNIAPDLRGGSDWFYWCIEVTANKAGQATFTLPSGKIGLKGPAMSYDGGDTWFWFGRPPATSTSFTHSFTSNQLTVRFASVMPYLQSHLDTFLAANASNQHLTTSVLTQSRGGVDVELLQIGQPGTGKKAVLFTCRHHACEAMASYVLEGFMKEAISNSSEAVSFRNNHVLYVVPFVDKDGVEAGDQGKNSPPWDHNRDYGLNWYTETAAIEALGYAKNIQFVVDWHCPTLVLDTHQLFYFDGPKSYPTYNFSNVSTFASNIDSEFPAGAPGGPLNWMNDNGAATMCTSHFATVPGMIMTTALETPYSPADPVNMDAASGLQYGAAILHAWVGTTFNYAPEYTLTVNNGDGDGSYIEDMVVAVTADAPPAGQVFDRWTGNTEGIANIYDPTTTITMPASATTVTATYKVPGPLYTLTVNSGSGGGSYWEHAVVDIVADTPAEGYDFVEWTGDTAYLDDPEEPSTSITMQSQNATVTATYELHTVDLMAHWEMEETTGTFSADSSGNGNSIFPGSTTISEATTSGKFGNGFYVDGTGDRFTHPTLLDVMPETVTIAGWVKPDTSAGGCWFSKQNGPSNANQLWMKFNSGSVIGVSGRSGTTYFTTNSTTTWASGTWYHVALTWDAAGMMLYIDGEEDGSSSTSIMSNGASMDLSIGTGGGTSQAFKGTVDDVRIYSDVLTAEDITDLYNLIP